MKKKNAGEMSIILVIIFGLVGFIIMYAGVNDIIKKSQYKEIMGTYNYTVKRITEDGATTYKWYYSYNVDGVSYEYASPNHVSPDPDKTVNTILYNSNNPSEAVEKSNNSGIAAICFGLVFALVPLLMYIKEKIDQKTDYKDFEIRSQRIILWIFVLAFLAALVMIFTNGSFDWKTMLLPTLCILVIFIISVIILIVSYLTKKPVFPTQIIADVFEKDGKIYKSYEEYQEDLIEQNKNNVTNPTADYKDVPYGADASDISKKE